MNLFPENQLLIATHNTGKLEEFKYLLKDLDLKLREFRPEHARFDIFINGQYILEQDYIFEQVGPDILIKFKKADEFSSTLESKFASLASSYKAKEYLLAEVLENPLFLLNLLSLNVND